MLYDEYRYVTLSDGRTIQFLFLWLSTEFNIILKFIVQDEKKITLKQHISN